LFASLSSIAPIGLDAEKISVETFVSPGLPKFIIVGLGDTAVQEARERVRSAIKNSGFKFPRTRVTANLAPADLRKAGPSFDFPIALGVLSSFARQVSLERLEGALCIGELALDGTLRHVPGILSLMACAVKMGFKRAFVPHVNAKEAALISGIKVYGIKHLKEMASYLQGEKISPIPKTSVSQAKKRSIDIDMAHVQGQDFAKRALTIAAAGGHNVLMNGSPGSGKTLMARAFRSILPSMSFEESLTVTKIYSLAGLLPSDTPLISRRPFRIVHHTASSVSLVGGGRIPHPGEISLAHKGVLFLDEIAEFPTNVLEVLRQPLEDHCITISRAQGTLSFPAHFTLIAAMNPCPCGYFRVPNTKKSCTCSPYTIQRYQRKLSGPFLDRIDLHCPVSPVSFQDLKSGSTQTSSDSIRDNVEHARTKQFNRFSKTPILTNSEMSSRMIRDICVLDTKSNELMEAAMDRFELSARAYYRILKVGRYSTGNGGLKPPLATIRGLTDI
jgi:magnesium chelatase family protein